MARAVIGLDLSERSWKSVAVSRAGKNCIRIHGYASFPGLTFAPQQLFLPGEEGLSSEPGLLEFAPHFAQALSPFLQEAAGFVVGIPEERVALRVLKLPFTQTAKIAQVLPFEAETTLPFDADELLFDFFPLAQANGGTKVLSAAIKKEHLESLLSRLKLLNVDPMIITPTALSFHHLLAVGGEEPEAGAQRTVFVQLGEEGTEISVVENGRTIFAVSLSVGFLATPGVVGSAEGGNGGKAPPTVREVGEIEGEAKAEASGGGVTSSSLIPRPDFLPTLLSVLSRVLHYLEGFSLGAEGCPPAVKRIILLGAGANLPGIGEKLTAELGVETVRFRLSPTALSETPEIAEELHPQLAPALALALQKAAPEGRPGLNFRQGLFAFKPERRALFRKMVFPGILVAVLLLSLGFRMALFGRAEKKKAKLAKAEIENLFRANFPNVPVVDPVAQVQQFVQEAKAKQQRYEVLALPEALEILSAISNVIPPEIDVTFRSLEYKGDRVSLYGTAKKYEDPNQITKFLQQVPFFAKADLEDVRKISEEEVNFVIKLEVKKGREP